MRLRRMPPRGGPKPLIQISHLLVPQQRPPDGGPREVQFVVGKRGVADGGADSVGADDEGGGCGCGVGEGEEEGGGGGGVGEREDSFLERWMEDGG
ncbi:hypothetical protein GRF29_103g193902 [Pseudopithomyces chartarum]|uniref:Uncharacterized protein n=1 Tax=Pseudopithomyces chartarum TaxID=1892770 RepID=A0AAN6LVZ6_9PLEO|nr:hypothetical protein GRF29_103g193902 [Pseudopithomyces chartarum]